MDKTICSGRGSTRSSMSDTRFVKLGKAIDWRFLEDLPLNFHPAAIRASAGFKPWGAGGATCDRRS